MSPWSREVRATTRLATPIVVAQLAQMGLGLCDVVMVGRYDDDALAGIALGHVLFWGLVGFGQRLISAIDPSAARSVGAGDARGLGRALQGGLLLAAVLSVPLTAIGTLAGPILGSLDQPPQVVTLAADYVLWSLPGMLPFLLFCTLRQGLQAMGRVRPVLVVMVLANVVNLAANFALVFGNWGAPELGLIGSAIASDISRLFQLATLLAFSWPVLRSSLLSWELRGVALRELLDLLRLGLPIGGQFLLEMGAFSAVTIMMGWFGSREVAAHQIAFQLAALSFMVPVGLSMAAAVRVGHAAGRDDPPGLRRAALVAMIGGGLVMVCSAGLFTLAPELLAAWFVESGDGADVVALAALLIPIAGLFQIFDGVQVVCGGVLRGLADTRTPFVVHLIAFWVLGLPIGWLLAFEWGVGPAGLWWGLTIGLAVTALALAAAVSRKVQRIADQAATLVA
jgi:MATE family multidrug resistance protein